MLMEDCVMVGFDGGVHYMRKRFVGFWCFKVCGFGVVVGGWVRENEVVVEEE